LVGANVALIFKDHYQGYHFGYCLNLTFKDENQYYGINKCHCVTCKLIV